MPGTQTVSRSGSNGASRKRRVSGARSRKRPRKRSRKDRKLIVDNEDKCTGREVERFLAQEFGIPESAARRVWRSALEHMRRSLLRGRSISLTNIATIQPYVKQAHSYRHPTTGEIEEAPERWHVRLIASPGLQDDLQYDHR